MASRMPSATDRSLGLPSDFPRPTPAKAGLAQDQVRFRDVMKAAIYEYYGSWKDAAFALGNVDLSLMQREFARGIFERFDTHADATAKSVITASVAKCFRVTDDPYTHALAQIHQARVAFDQLEQLVEFVRERRSA